MSLGVLDGINDQDIIHIWYYVISFLTCLENTIKCLYICSYIPTGNAQADIN